MPQKPKIPKLFVTASVHIKNPFRVKLGRKAHKKGYWSEHLAAFLLRLKGYRLIERRWRSPCGEIDIIARKGKIIALVEIKARPDMQKAMEALSPAQQKRIEAAADLWLAQQPAYAGFSLRFDLIAICPRRLPQHIKAYWTV